MAISATALGRVSQNLKAFNLLSTVRGNQVRLFDVQNQLATGMRFQSPSQDPVRASAAIRLDRRVDVLNTVSNNLRVANEALREGEAALADGVELAREGYRIALETASDTSSPDERRSLTAVVDSILRQMVSVGNRQYLDTYLFSGHYGESLPFELQEGGVYFRGDAERMYAITDSDLSQDFFTISGRDFFNATSAGVRGFNDLNPAVTPETRLADLNGAAGLGVTPGKIVVTNGGDPVEIDLSTAATVGDVLDLLAANLPAGVSATLTAGSINLAAASPFSVEEAPGGRTAADLGIFEPNPVMSVLGDDLNARLTERTPLSVMNAGAGINLANGLTIRNGPHVVTFDFSTAETLEDVLNTINHSEARVWARIAEDGERIEVLNRLSGSDLTIEENGGNAATALGIRSMYGGTKLSALNENEGVTTVAGNDLRIVTASGANIDIDLDALDLNTATLDDAINLINTAGGGAVTASLAASGNGIQIVDNTAGTETLRVERLNVSPAMDWLGLDVQSSGGVLTGRDVNPVRVDSPFAGLVELRRALEADDSELISRAANRLDRSMRHMERVQGELASKARQMLDRSERTDGEMTATQVLMGDVRDVDIAEAVVRFQQYSNALQANLSSSARVFDLSLLDYLR